MMKLTVFCRVIEQTTTNVKQQTRAKVKQRFLEFLIKF